MAAQPHDGSWLGDLDDSELTDLHDQVLQELYIRAHLRSHLDTLLFGPNANSEG